MSVSEIRLLWKRKEMKELRSQNCRNILESYALHLTVDVPLCLFEIGHIAILFYRSLEFHRYLCSGDKFLQKIKDFYLDEITKKKVGIVFELLWQKSWATI